MGSPSCLSDPGSLLVLDTSAAINLIATGFAREILEALPNRVLAVDAVRIELEDGHRRGKSDAEVINGLVAARCFAIETLGEKAMENFEGLVIGRAADTLDDGEAATIAYAVEHGATAIIDERKAIRVCRQKFPRVRLGCTVDLLAHQDVSTALGHKALSEAVLNALQQARMRVLPQHMRWVVDVIGTEQATLCASLPRAVRSSGRGR